MKVNILLFLSLLLCNISCTTGLDSNDELFLIKVDKIELSKTITLGDTLHISFYGTIGNNGGYSFERFDSSLEGNNLNLKVWGKYKATGAQSDVMVYLDGRKFNFVPVNKGDYKIIVNQPDGSKIEQNVIVQSPKSLEEELLSLVYSSYKWPEGFYTEQLSGGDIYYENTVSTKPLEQRNGIWIELSTNDKDTAKKWSDLSAGYSSYYRAIVSEEENEKYFEFRRANSVNPLNILLSRVHKTSYLDRSMFDINNPTEIIGKFNKTNFTKDDVIELIEYLWFVKHYNNASSKVHRTEIAENKNEYLFNLYEILTSYGYYGDNFIRYIKYSYSIRKDNGEITQQKEILKEFNG